MLKKDIRNTIKELEKKLFDLKTSRDLRLLRAKKEYEDIYTRIDNELDKDREKIREEILKLQELAKPKKRVVKSVPEELKKWLRKYSSGIDKGDTWSVIWYSTTFKYVIVRKPGHSYWNGIGMPYAYGSTDYVLCKINENIKNCKILEIGGRLTKEKFQELINEVPEEDREGIKIK